jgi:hypothetical protein
MERTKIWNVFLVILTKIEIMFKVLAKINKAILPSYSKQRLELAKATKLQKAIIAWRYYVTIHALEKK